MGISEFEDETIIGKCLEDDCVLDVNAQAQQGSSGYELTVDFAGNVEELTVSELVLFGLDQSKSINVSLETPWTVSDSSRRFTVSVSSEAILIQ